MFILANGTQVHYVLATSANVKTEVGTIGIYNPFENEGYVEYSTSKDEAIKMGLARQRLLHLKEARESKSA